MTTIVYRDGVLAADSMCTAGNLRLPGAVTKIVRAKDGRLGGACGDASFCEAWNRWLRGERKEMPEPGPATKDDGGDAGLIIHKDGRLELCEGPGSYFVDAPYYAIGAGDAVAMGAFYMGATAEQAIRAAIAHDIYTGGEPTILALDMAKAKAA